MHKTKMQLIQLSIQNIIHQLNKKPSLRELYMDNAIHNYKQIACNNNKKVISAKATNRNKCLI